MIRFALAQQDFTVGDIRGNRQTVLRLVEQARAAQADLVIFPELALSGYPPEDLLLRPAYLQAVEKELQTIITEVQGIDVLLGHPWLDDGQCFNAVSWIRNGKVLGRYYKQRLPNYGVFDEQRYFTAGHQPLVVELKGQRLGVLICEDCWEYDPPVLAQQAGAELLLVTNASPYRDNKLQVREAMFDRLHQDIGLPMVYCNLVGGQDELVFDGRSMLMNRDGSLSAPGPLCEDCLLLCDYDAATGQFLTHDWAAPPAEQMAEIYRVLKRGLADYVRKNGFTDVVFGLSGGVDSALTLALAVDALGAEHVHTIMMPSRYTSGLSIELAQQQAISLGVDHRCITIEPVYEALLTVLAPSFSGRDEDVTEENLQARARGNIVMSLSNKFGWLPLVTSNKSESAMGYCTLYGDMCGGFAPLIDCLKTRVYELARYRNQLGPGIPEEVIERAPSAELRPNQTDQDSLPPYAVLDEVLRRFIEEDQGVEEIVQAGFDAAMVSRVARLVLLNEYKRRQGAPGTRITQRALGRDWRYPITSAWRG